MPVLAMTEWLPVLRDFGIFGGLVLFFTWTNWKTNEQTQQFVRETLVALVEQSNRLIAQNTEAMDRLSEKVGKCPVREQD